MKARKIESRTLINSHARRVASICFDERSLARIMPGFKLVYAPDDPPVFVSINEVDDKAPFYR